MAQLKQNLVIENLSFGHSEKKLIFKNFNRTYIAGHSYLISAPSGRGKTTLARLICGHLKPHSGTLSIGEKSLTLNPGHHCQYVAQDDDLFGWLKVREQLQLPFKEWSQQREERLLQLLAQFELGEILNFYPHQLSTGMRKRVSLIRSLLLEPSVIILDETLASLDGRNATKTLQFLTDWKVQAQAIILVISHQQESGLDFIETLDFL